MRRRPLLIGLGALPAWPARTAAGAEPMPRRIAFPRPWAGDSISGYAMSVVKLALGEAAPRYALTPVEQPDMIQAQILDGLAHGRGEVQMLWSMSSLAREAQLTPIRIPLDRGLLGWRVPLIREQDLAQWQALDSPGSLRRLLYQLAAGQGHDWPDTEVLRANGLRVQTTTRFAPLFKMLAQRRFDYFPRSVLEAEAEARAHAAEGLVIAPRALIVYPTATYFFVSTQEPEFARQLAAGLERLVRSGELRRLFLQHFDPLLKSLGVRERVMVRLRNPLLSPETPLHRAELWEQP